jgi:hypothetical protein
MMWHWKHNGLNVKTYSEKAGNFLLVQTGLVDKDLDQFYRRLGMRGARASGSSLRQALVHSPVIFTQGDKVRGHALVAAGANTDSYEVVNPCQVESVDFEDEGESATVCQGGRAQIASGLIDPNLGALIWYW